MAAAPIDRKDATPSVAKRRRHETPIRPESDDDESEPESDSSCGSDSDAASVITISSDSDTSVLLPISTDVKTPAYDCRLLTPESHRKLHQECKSCCKDVTSCAVSCECDSCPFSIKIWDVTRGVFSVYMSRHDTPDVIRRRIAAAVGFQDPSKLKFDVSASTPEEWFRIRHDPVALYPTNPLTGVAYTHAEFMDRPSTMEIFVKTLTGKTLTLRVLPEDRAATLKYMIYVKDGVPPFDLRVTYAGKQLEDGRMLKEYEVGRESTLHAVLRQRGS